MAFDLVGLTDRPEKDAKASIKENRMGRAIRRLVRVSRMSSANNETL